MFLAAMPLADVPAIFVETLDRRTFLT